MNIPKRMKEIQERVEFATRETEMYDKAIVLIDHDTCSSNQEFLNKVNSELNTCFSESDINVERKWKINNVIAGEKELDLFIRCLPETETGAIEAVMLDALTTDEVEEKIISDSDNFIVTMSQEQNRYLQRKSLISKAIFNTYFSIRTPEEKYDERARILNSFDWKNNEVINRSFSFLDI